MNPDEPLRTKNLANEDPAPMDDTLGGYPWLPRMIDKARASRAGLLGLYFRYPCPIDSTCLETLALSANAFADIAVKANWGREILDALDQTGALSSQAASFDPLALNTLLHSDES